MNCTRHLGYLCINDTKPHLIACNDSKKLSNVVRTTSMEWKYGKYRLVVACRLASLHRRSIGLRPGLYSGRNSKLL